VSGELLQQASLTKAFLTIFRVFKKSWHSVLNFEESKSGVRATAWLGPVLPAEHPTRLPPVAAASSYSAAVIRDWRVPNAATTCSDEHLRLHGPPCCEKKVQDT